MNAWAPSPGFLAAAAGIVVGAVLLGWWQADTPAPPSPAAGSAAPAALAVPVSSPAAGPVSSPAAPAPTQTQAATAQAPAVTPPPVDSTQQIARTRNPGDDPTPDLSDYVNPGERPTMPEVIQRLRQAGIQSGLAAFPPPGTRPPLVGLAVPEDFVLPEGYVRHYQATDDGQRIEAILMFSPDRQVLDANGQAVTIPENRVVPPELAPPGMPLRQVVIPAPVEAGRPGS